MKVFIKEQLYILDYKDEIIDCIFNSDDHNTPGYAYNISVEDSNTGYSNLSFTMPTRIIPDGGVEAIHNPKLKYVKPLTKVRYERETIYTGDKAITVSVPKGYGDTTIYEEVVYNPGDLIEIGANVDGGKFKMDYIIQPLDKKRSGLEVSMTFTAIDYPRFNLSKKKLGSTIDENTLTRGEWSIFDKSPMSIEGSVQYVRWSGSLNTEVFGRADAVPLTWDPSTASDFVLNEAQLDTLLRHASVWTYGVIATVFYWPITQTGRFEGVLYNKGDYLTLSFYEKNLAEVIGAGVRMSYEEGNQNYVLKKYTWTTSYNSYIECSNISEREYLVFSGNLADSTYLGAISEGSAAPIASQNGQWYICKVRSGQCLDFYAYTWNYYEQGKPYLTPNNPCNYLNWILENTNWTIKLRTDKIFKGTYWKVNQFPAGVANGYLMLKSIKDDEKSTYVDQTNYTIYTSSASIPTTGVNASQWAIVSNSSGTNVYHFNSESKEWYLSRDDISKINTKFYVFENNAWTETADMWAASIDKETGVLYDVDQVEKEIAKPDNSVGSLFETTQLRCSLSASDSNCYNIITELCKSFQLYPVFDCINRTVALHIFCGKNFGLTYKIGKSLENTTVKEDGEKVITKLRCYGGTDAQGSEAINLGDANRQYIKTFTGYYTGIGSDVPPTVGVEGYVAIIDPNLDVARPWIVGANRVVKYLNGGQWNNATNNQDGTWSFVLGGISYTVDEQAGTSAPWNPNDDQYIQARSPYGTEYIYNFKWMYDNGWMTKEDILGLYKKSLEIQDLNKGFLDKYAENSKYAYEMSVKAGVDYKANQDEYTACLNSMMSGYYKNSAEASEGTFDAFHIAPADTYSVGNNHYIDMFHCYSCGYTHYISHNTPIYSKCPNCFAEGANNIQKIAIKIPVYGDAGYTSINGNNANSLKRRGFYYEVSKDIGDTYTAEVKLATEIPHRTFTSIGEQQVFLFGTGSSQVEIYDKSSHMYNWNDYVAKWQYYYGLQLDDLRVMNNYINIVEALDEEYNQYVKSFNELEDYIQDHWGDYIVEGKYKDDTICYSNILLAKSLDASDEYCIPKITYNANVVDSSGLIEYRRPMNETYNELVHSLHNMGQIVPRAGDYTALIDEQLGLYGVPAVITSIKRSLDNPQTNSITVDTSYTDNEELVGNIITATNTVLNNSDIYARTAIIKADGTIASASLNKSLEQNSGDNLAFVGSKGSSILDSSGLVVADPGNINRKMKYAGNGTFGTTDNGLTWSSILSPSGINADYIYAGSIDTQHVQIMSGKNAKVVLDNLGLAVKTNENQSYHLPTATKVYDGETVPDWSGTNLSAFVGVDKNNSPHLYVKGELVADKGSKIGGWFVGTNNLINAVSNPTLWLSPNGKNGTVLGNQANYSIYSNGNFGITTNGKLLANGAHISGKIEITDSTSTMNTGTVGGLTASSSGLSSGDTIVISPTGYSGAVTIAPGVSSSGPWAIYSKGNFGVTTGGTLWAVNGKFGGEIQATSGKIGGWTIDSAQLLRHIEGDGNSYNIELRSDRAYNGEAILVWDCINNRYNFYVKGNGDLYARNADISGTINATAGTIGGCSISGGVLQIKNANIDTLAVSKITGGSNGASITFNGAITCNNLIAKNSGNIGGWTISSNKLGGDDVYLNPNGNFAFYNNHRVVGNSSLTLNSQQGKGAILCDGMTSPTDGCVTLAASSDSKVRIVSLTGGIQIRASQISAGTSDSDKANLPVHGYIAFISALGANTWYMEIRHGMIVKFSKTKPDCDKIGEYEA